MIVMKILRKLLKKKIGVIIILMKREIIGMNAMRHVKLVIHMVQKIDKDVKHVKLDIIMLIMM